MKNCEVDIKRVGWFIKETSDKIVIVNYIKITLSTSTEIVYTGCNRLVLLFNYTLTIPLTIRLYDS